MPLDSPDRRDRAQGADLSDISALQTLLESVRAENEALRARCERFAENGKKCIRQREAWKARALEAEAQRESLEGKLASREDDLTAAVLDLEALRSPADAEVPQSLSALKRIISLNLHPDAGGRGDADKAALFAELWPHLEELEKARA